jgi:hypothetical protein
MQEIYELQNYIFKERVGVLSWIQVLVIGDLIEPTPGNLLAGVTAHYIPSDGSKLL